MAWRRAWPVVCRGLLQDQAAHRCLCPAVQETLFADGWRVAASSLFSLRDFHSSLLLRQDSEAKARCYRFCTALRRLHLASLS